MALWLGFASLRFHPHYLVYFNELAGGPQHGPLWLPMLVWFALWVLYLSIVNVGQRFYGFGWESLLLEAGFVAVFLGSADTAPPGSTAR